MSLPHYLSSLKSSGTYRYVWDKSVVPDEQQDSLRLLVGYSERGPFNTPVYIATEEDFVNTFGNISRRMERKGIFFHRLCLQALKAGPILALNLKPFSNERGSMLSFNASDIKLSGDSIILDNVTPTYKKDGDNYVEDLAGSATYYLLNGKYLQVTTKTYVISPDKIYYKDADGKYTLATEDQLEAGKSLYAKYLQTYFAVTKSTDDGGAAKYTADMYPGTITADTIKQAGLKIAQTFKGGAGSGSVESTALVGNVNTTTPRQNPYTIYDTNRFWKIADDIMNIRGYLSKNDATPNVITDYIRIVQTGSKEDSVTVFIRPFRPTGYDVKISDWYSNVTDQDMPPYMQAIRDHYLSEFFAEIYVFRSDFRDKNLFEYTGTLGAYPAGTDTTLDAESAKNKWIPFCKVDDSIKDYEGKPTVRTNESYVNAFGELDDALEAMSNVSTSNFVNMYQGILFPSFNDASGNCISLDAVFNKDYKSHKCWMQFNEALLDDAYEADQDDNDTIGDDEKVPGEITAAVGEDNDSSVSSIVCALSSGVNGPDDVPVSNASVYGYYLKGYDYQTIKRSDKGSSLVGGKIMPVLKYKGIYEALTNNVDSDWHYLVDTFQGYPGTSMKADFASVCQKKFNCLGILNFPPMKDCAVFLGYPGMIGGFEMSKVVARNSGISLPVESQGASFVAFYSQLKMSDGSYNFIVPSAALVSNLYMTKYSQYKPYDCIAGTNKGTISYPGVVGPDYNYARNDLDQLEPFGLNCITMIPRYGNVINSECTAKQTPVSALSNVHVRELCTYIQDEIENILRKYWWEVNNDTLRANIKAKADTILGQIQGNGGITEFSTVCDSTNNNAETEAAGIVLLALEVVPSPTTKKLVQTLTLRKAGTISNPTT